VKGLLAILALVLSCLPASAERLIVSLSSHRIEIASNFVGSTLVLFGSVERRPGEVVYDGAYDIVAIMRGPRRTLVTRRKDRLLGLWVNVESRSFVEVPAVLYILANRPFADLASPDLRDRLQLGLSETVLTQRVGADFGDTVATDPFRINFLRLQEKAGLYREMPGQVTFLTPTLFRANIPLPANVPPGAYEVDVRVLGSEQVLAREIAPLEIAKVGFEEFVARSARNHAFAYGLFAAALALMVGWVGAVLFRRD
jgi:uncharacterized protein (TIGR02186 family)